MNARQNPELPCYLSAPTWNFLTITDFLNLYNNTVMRLPEKYENKHNEHTGKD